MLGAHALDPVELGIGARRCRQLRCLDVHIGQRLGGKRHCKTLRVAQEPVPVLQPAKAFVEPTDLVENVPLGHQGAAWPNGAAEQNFPAEMLRLHRKMDSHGPAILVQVVAAHAGRNGAALTCEHGQLMRELVRLPRVVGIKKGQPVAMRSGDSGVSGGAGAAIVRVRDYLDSPAAPACGNVSAAVGAGVIDDDDLEVVEGLSRHTVQCARDRGLPVKDRNDHAHLRRIGQTNAFLLEARPAGNPL